MFNDKNSSILQVIYKEYRYSLFMVLSSKDGGSNTLYEGLCTFESYGEENFFPIGF
jgi:hypothetical protein